MVKFIENNRTKFETSVAGAISRNVPCTDPMLLILKTG